MTGQSHPARMAVAITALLLLLPFFLSFPSGNLLFARTTGRHRPQEMQD
jgi:hypothetical protein